MKKIRSSSSILLTSVSILSLVSIALAAFVMTSSHHDFTIQFVDKDESGTIAVDDDSIDAKFQVFSSSKLGRFSKDIGITYTANADYTITSPISLKWEATLPENFEDYFDVTATRGTLLADSQDDSVATFTLPSTSLGAKIKDAVTFEEAREQFSSDSIKLSFTTVQEDVETTISLDKTNIELKVGEEEQLTATVNPESNVAFSSEDNEIASVGAYGLVHANSVGETYIVATANGVSARCKVTVTDDTLDYVIEHDEGAFNQFKNYTEKKLILKNEAGINSKLFAELFTCGNPKQTLIDVLKKDLTSNSLQSADELLKVGSVFNIGTANLVNGKEEHEKLRRVFIVSNQITHEMDVDMTALDFKMRDRTYEEINDYSEFIINFIEKFIELISEKLDDTSEVDEFEQIVSL